MEHLNEIAELIKTRKNPFLEAYYIPKEWNCIGYPYGKDDETRPNEISVDPYDFFAACLKAIKSGGGKHDGKQPELTQNMIYGILPRVYTAWRHGKNGTIYPGTLLKTMLILPMLKEYGVSILYLLPIFKTGREYKKGDLGSPYAIQDIYRIDERLHDRLLGEYSEKLLQTEFAAFVEACHALGIKVMIDFAFRTVARDNALIAQHPDWFYWIKQDFDSHFAPLTIADREKPYSVNAPTLRQLYQSPELHRYLSQFTSPPNEIDPQKWKKVKAGPQDGLAARIKKEFGITVAPGFSDVINDRQPAWTDVTYLKYYYDACPMVQKYLPHGQPPYIMQDGASLSTFHGEQKNSELWDYVTGVLPYYHKEYGIDGARIDMAHAMPTELNAAIIRKIREVSPDFLLWSEELDPAQGLQAEQDGFNLISGNTYFVYKKTGGASFNRNLFDHCYLKSKLPIVASLETPDTPRSAQIHRNSALLRMLTVLNAFMPNSVPYINCGQELLERQPMNLGLDNDEQGRFILPKEDPMYGKLAFFDTCCLHWGEEDGWMKRTLRDIAALRRNYRELLSAGNYIPLPGLAGNSKLTAVCYYDAKAGSGLLITANRSETSSAVLRIEKLLPQKIPRGLSAALIYDKDAFCEKTMEAGKGFALKPCEVALIEFHNH